MKTITKRYTFKNSYNFNECYGTYQSSIHCGFYDIDFIGETDDWDAPVIIEVTGPADDEQTMDWFWKESIYGGSDELIDGTPVEPEYETITLDGVVDGFTKEPIEPQELKFTKNFDSLFSEFFENKLKK